MSILDSFTDIAGAVIGGNTRQTSRSLGRVTSNLDTAVTSFKNLATGNGNPIDNFADGLGAVDTLINGRSGTLGQVASAIRMANNALQGVGYGASPQEKSFTKAIIRDDYNTVDAIDWRVKIQGPSDLIQGEVLKPISNTGNSMIFPFTPTVIIGSSANYSAVHPTHTNHPFYAYENSQIDNLTLTGEFFSENDDDAKYWVACLHFLRTMTKMYYGKSENLGNPPPVCRLNGYGKHVFNNVPVLITNFTTDMPADVDYIECDIAGEVTYVPTQSIITVTVAPNYARTAHSRFSLEAFARGDFITTDEGFI
jgi:hypothetical protein